jgi:hypothetical protein
MNYLYFVGLKLFQNLILYYSKKLYYSKLIIDYAIIKKSYMHSCHISRKTHVHVLIIQCALTCFTVLEAGWLQRPGRRQPGGGGRGAAAGTRRRGAGLGGEELGEERNERADEVQKCSGSLWRNKRPFAECQITGTRQRLGKEIFAECQNTGTRQSFLFFYFLTHQRELLKYGNLCRVSINWTLGKDNICRALFCDTRQNIFIYFSFFHPNFFCCDSRLP